eukprot:247028-Amphidinium_carterae.1
MLVEVQQRSLAWELQWTVAHNVTLVEEKRDTLCVCVRVTQNAQNRVDKTWNTQERHGGFPIIDTCPPIVLLALAAGRYNLQSTASLS